MYALFVFIVQSQYEFVYDVVLDAVTCGETAIPCSELRGLLTKLTKTDTGSPLDEQFKVSYDNLLTIIHVFYHIFLELFYIGSKILLHIVLCFLFLEYPCTLNFKILDIIINNF